MPRARSAYPDVGATARHPPPGWTFDEQAATLGRGEAVFTAAVAALRRWRQFDLGWVTMHHDGVPLEPGRAVAFVAWQLGLWSLNVCRIVYVLDEDDGIHARFGFVYGTSSQHVVRGEELFLLTWDRETDDVRFQITKFSRPDHPLLRFVGPIVRRVQTLFSTEALERMRREVMVQVGVDPDPAT